MTQYKIDQKGHGYFRKHKAVKGLATGIAIAGVMVSTQTAKADEVANPATEPTVASVAPPVEVTNQATNLVEPQPAPTPEHVQAIASTGQVEGTAISAPVESSALDQAVAEATATGVVVTEEKEVVKDNLNDALADLDNQEKTVEKATETQKETDAIRAENTEKAKKAGVIETPTKAVTYTNQNAEALKDAKEQAGRVDVAVSAQLEISSKLPEEQEVATDAGVKVVVGKAVRYADAQKALEDLGKQLADLKTATSTRKQIDEAVALAIAEARKSGVQVTVKDGKTTADIEQAIAEMKTQLEALLVKEKAQEQANTTLASAKTLADGKGLVVKPTAPETVTGATEALEHSEAIYNQTVAAVAIKEEANASLNKAEEEAVTKGTVVTRAEVITTTPDKALALAKEQTTALAQVVADNERKKQAYQASLTTANEKETIANSLIANAESNAQLTKVTNTGSMTVTADQAEAEAKKIADAIAKVEAENQAIKTNNEKGQAAVETRKQEIALAEAQKAQALAEIATIQGANKELQALATDLNNQIKAKADEMVKGATTDRFTASSSQVGTIKVATAEEAQAKAQEIMANMSLKGGSASGAEIPADQKEAYDKALATYKAEKEALLNSLRSGQGVRIEVLEVTKEFKSSFSGAILDDGSTTIVGAYDGYGFKVKDTSDDGTGFVGGQPFEENYWQLRVNSDATYDENSGQGVIVLNSITVEGHEVVTYRNNAAVAQNHGYNWNAPDGSRIHSYYNTQGSTGYVPIDKTYAVNKELRLSPGQNSEWVYAGVSSPDWIEENPTHIYIRVSYNPSIKELIPPTPPTPVSYAGGGGHVDYSLLEVMETPTPPVPPVPDPISFNPDPYKPAESKTIVVERPGEPDYAEATISPINLEVSHTPVTITAQVDVPVLEVASHPIQMTVPTHDVIVATKVHPVLIEQKPTNVKAVYNLEGQDINGKPVAKGSTVSWATGGEVLKAGRPLFSEITREDFLDSGQTVDMEKTKASSDKITFTYNPKTHSVLQTVKASVLAEANLDQTRPFILPEGRIYTTVLNDGATYDNNFTTTFKSADTVIIDKDGKIRVDGKTNVYKTTSNKVVITTPTKSQPEKHIYTKDGQQIDGKSVLPNSELYYTARYELAQYKGVTATKADIDAGFTFFDDPQDSTVNFHFDRGVWTTASGQVLENVFTRHEFDSLDAVKDEQLKSLIAKSGFKPAGNFGAWLPTDPAKFYADYVVTGTDLFLTFPISTGNYTGTFKNTVHQVVFGNGYAGNIVENNIPKLEAIKDVLKSIGSGQSIANGTVALGQEFPYSLKSPRIPVNLAGGIQEVKLYDDFDERYDEYNGEFYAFASSDMMQKDGKAVTLDEEITRHITQKLIKDKDGKVVAVEYLVNKDFIDTLAEDQHLDFVIYPIMKRIAYGENIKNTLIASVNGVEVSRSEVVTHTPKPTPPAPEVPVKPGVPQVQTPQPPAPAPKPEPSKPTLPNTGEASGLLMTVTGALTSVMGLIGLGKRKESN